MQPRIHVITLAVNNLERSLEFYSGYFRDPDGHLWEVMWNPQLDSQGLIPGPTPAATT